MSQGKRGAYGKLPIEPNTSHFQSLAVACNYTISLFLCLAINCDSEHTQALHGEGHLLRSCHSCTLAYNTLSRMYHIKNILS